MNKTAIAITTVVVLSVGGVVALTFRPAGGPALESMETRIESLETLVNSQKDQIAELERHIAKQTSKYTDPDLEARLAAREGRAVGRTAITNEDGQPPTEVREEEVMARLRYVEDTVAETDREMSYVIEERVTEVVDEKISALEERKSRKEDKKPSFEVFAEVLELTESQRTAVEDEIWIGQRDIRAILEMPTEDGSDLVGELVEAMAHGQAGRPEAPWLFMEWVGRLVSEKIPDSNVTYGALIEETKNDVRTALRRELNTKQYAEFESWRMDPTEVKEIEGSPWDDLEERIEQRVFELTE